MICKGCNQDKVYFGGNHAALCVRESIVLSLVLCFFRRMYAVAFEAKILWINCLYCECRYVVCTKCKCLRTCIYILQVFRIGYVQTIRSFSVLCQCCPSFCLVYLVLWFARRLTSCAFWSPYNLECFATHEVSQKGSVC